MKDKYNPLKECKNYAKVCGIANNCFYCRNRKMEGAIVSGCRKGKDINDIENLRNCFECVKEGRLRCSD